MEVMFRKIHLWLLLLVFVCCCVASIYFAHLVYTGGKATIKTKRQQIALTVASTPTVISELLRTGLSISLKGGVRQRDPRLLNGKFKENLTVADKDFAEDGFLLVSAYSDEEQMVIVELIDLSRNESIWKWVPNPKQIVDADRHLNNLRESGELSVFEQRAGFRSQAPLLFEDGSIVVTSGEGSLSKWSPCSQLSWVNSRHFHHSIEFAGKNILVPIVIEPSATKGVRNSFRDDGFAIVDAATGSLISEESIINILQTNGVSHTVFGHARDADAIHLNDAEMIYETDSFVRAGDIMLSARHTSTVYLYRPSTKKLIWYKKGPWLAQHDIDYLGDGKFSIFGNDHLLLGGVFPNGQSDLYIYDVGTGAINTPYTEIMKEEGVTEISQGRSEILANGDLFVERSNAGIILRVSEDKVRWRYVRKTNHGIGAMFWSRYFHSDEINIDWIKRTRC